MSHDGDEPTFKLNRYNISGMGSITAILSSETTLCGLYVLHFTNNEGYVGQSVNVANRYGSHRRTWQDIEAIEFAPWPADDLDRGERQLISVMEHTKVLRNGLLTTLPGGDADVVVSVEDARQVVLPWDRRSRITIDTAQAADEQRRFWELHRNEVYPAVRAFVAAYINESIPDPVNTQRYLWNVTALPSTGRVKNGRRLLTLNCGNLETLFVSETTLEDGIGSITISVNIDIPDDLRDNQLIVENEVFRARLGSYRSQRVWAWDIDLVGLIEGDVDFDSCTGETEFDGLAYRLNVRLMRRSSSSYYRYHNADLANDLLAEAYRQRTGPDADAVSASSPSASAVLGDALMPPVGSSPVAN